MPNAFSGFSSWLRSWRSAPDQAPIEQSRPSAPALPSDAFPLLPPGELLLRCRAKVSRIEELAGTTPAHFERYYLETLHRFARYVQQRPASQASHSRPGGMLDLGLDTAAAALKDPAVSLDILVFDRQGNLKGRTAFTPSDHPSAFSFEERNRRT